MSEPSGRLNSISLIHESVQAEEEYQASQVQSTKDELANQKFLTEYVACMAGIELPVDEEETEGMTHVQDFE